jgi:peptidoglycan/xylan/chitin deacetylase (PgdA/CDA1 family)
MTEVLVLCYHAVSPTWGAALSVTPAALEAQLSKLIRGGWRGATFRDAVLSPPWTRTLAVTFDDAFLSVLDIGRPILSRLGLPGTVFVPTAFAAQRQPLRWPGTEHWLETRDAQELSCMSWGDLAVLVSEGWEVASHTRSHPRLPSLDDQALRFELEDSRRECTERLGVPCDTLAYPYGDADERVADFARAAGYRAAASLSSSLRNAGTHRWPRVGIYHDDPMWRFGLKVNRTVLRLRASRMWPAHE